MRAKFKLGGPTGSCLAQTVLMKLGYDWIDGVDFQMHDDRLCFIAELLPNGNKSLTPITHDQYDRSPFRPTTAFEMLHLVEEYDKHIPLLLNS